jgi:hypothetical protein
MITKLDGVKVEYRDLFHSNESQCQQILDHMLDGKRIDGMTSLREYGCNRLPARILDLSKRGHTIDNEWRTVNGKRFKAYFIREALTA